MVLFSWVRDERVVLAGLAVTTVGVVVGMHAILRRFRDASEIKPVQPKTQYITQETEDALPAPTLNSLLDHYNFSIRETAAKIVCDRAINDDKTLRFLLRGIAQPDYEERMKNLRALAMLTDQNSLHLLNTPHAYEAFVRSLDHCIAEAEHPMDMLNDAYYDEYYLRDIAEKLCLMFLAQLTAIDVDALVRAGFVERWLARQGWGSTPQERTASFSSYLRVRGNRIADICRRLRASPAGRAALERAMLVQPLPQPAALPAPPRVPPLPSANDGRHPPEDLSDTAPVHESEEGETEGVDYARGWTLQPGAARLLTPEELRAVQGVVATDGEAVVLVSADAAAAAAAAEDDGGGGEPSVRGRLVLGALDNEGGASADADADANLERAANATRQPRPPLRTSREEQRIRRQHREAMVLNDGTRPLRRADIIEREHERD
ncbi:cytoskeleton-associated protein [Niveomyces insectorum RCEF 264]|uniref:Cytoskeleton-associated protein n=1 Tax=Niveomyces insectorum RCEF 264 TaxID=1081102 RepID=A0A167WE64_9HYPO|nr:cytoskeleton-associated protein [Niveomyces insectorum RCEF 264]